MTLSAPLTDETTERPRQASLVALSPLGENSSLSQSIPRPDDRAISTLSYRDQVFLQRDGLYAEFQPLVRRLIRQYGGDNAELREDLAGEIYYRFCQLLEVYDPERGVPLRPYLVRQLTASVY